MKHYILAAAGLAAALLTLSAQTSAARPSGPVGPDRSPAGEDPVAYAAAPDGPIPARFPSLLRLSVARASMAGAVAPAALWTARSAEEEASRGMARRFAAPAILSDDLVGFYGSPASKVMGILGVYPIDQLTEILESYLSLYDAANGERGVRGVYYLIYGACWPGGEIGYLRDSIVLKWIAEAQRRGYLVVVDHQIGKYGVEAGMERILPFLKYPNVHLAIDPEWSTTKPMEEIGGIDAEDVNRAQRMMQDYMRANGIPGRKMLVVHQFHAGMISRRELVRADFEGVDLVHFADGFGSPGLKRSSYAYNGIARNIPIKGFKLFFQSGTPGAGFDEPLLTPAEVMALKPRPMFVLYQ